MFLSRDRIPVNDVRVFHGLHACIQPENRFLSVPNTSRTLSAMSRSSRDISSEEPSSTVTCEPNETYMEANSSPMYPPTYNDELYRQLSQFHNGGAGIYPWVTLYPLYRWNDGFGTRIDEYPGSLQL